MAATWRGLDDCEPARLGAPTVTLSDSIETLSLKMRDKLPPKTKKVFDYFVKHANKIGLHPSDWENFYEFMNACHDFRVKLTEEDLVSLLIEESFPEKRAREIADVYYHIRAFMRGYKKRNYKRLYTPRVGKL